jgi:CheY-like chemotaxis protein
MQVVERALLPADEIGVILGALNALKRGDASVRLPADWPGSLGRVADVFNDVVERDDRMAQELERFTVSLPAAAPAQRTKGEATEWGRTTSDHLDLCVLVVDDNHDVAESKAVLLRLVGCEVHLAHDGEEALRLVPRVRPDAVLLDIGLPRMNGYEVAERIRSDPENRDMLIVAVSGYGQQEHRLRSKQAGFDQHVVKPIDPSVLSSLLATFSSQRAAASSENVVNFRLRKTAE